MAKYSTAVPTTVYFFETTKPLYTVRAIRIHNTKIINTWRYFASDLLIY